VFTKSSTHSTVWGSFEKVVWEELRLRREWGRENPAQAHQGSREAQIQEKLSARDQAELEMTQSNDNKVAFHLGG